MSILKQYYKQNTMDKNENVGNIYATKYCIIRNRIFVGSTEPLTCKIVSIFVYILPSSIKYFYIKEKLM